MANRLNRRTFLTGTAAAGAGLYLGARPIRRANAAGKITVGVEAGSPYEKFWLLDVSNGFEDIREWRGDQVDDGDVGFGVSIAPGARAGGLEDAVQAFEACVGVG